MRLLALFNETFFFDDDDDEESPFALVCDVTVFELDVDAVFCGSSACAARRLDAIAAVVKRANFAVFMKNSFCCRITLIPWMRALRADHILP
jgi:hypothetical protein